MKEYRVAWKRGKWESYSSDPSDRKESALYTAGELNAEIKNPKILNRPPIHSVRIESREVGEWKTEESNA